MALSLVVLAAGLGTRFGGAKQLAPIGPAGETLMEFAAYDALSTGFTRVVFVVRPENERAVRERVRLGLSGSAQVAFALQRQDDLPGGHPLRPGRVRPWGTGHAVLAAESAVDGPFAVCNADDFYGRSSFSLVARCLIDPLSAPLPLFCVVGFPLDATLSGQGGVSRALCLVTERGLVQDIQEVRDVRRIDGAITGRMGAAPVSLTGAEMVSMNLWGFTPEVFSHLRMLFGGFLEHHGRDPESEFLLPDAVREMLGARVADVRLVPASDRWAGITHPGDGERVARRIQDLVRRGVYTTPLFPTARQ